TVFSRPCGFLFILQGAQIRSNPSIWLFWYQQSALLNMRSRLLDDLFFFPMVYPVITEHQCLEPRGAAGRSPLWGGQKKEEKP
ncbi:MAG: hypothetical protein J5947_08050, partial [Clostridium sp.]|nr:hypothetical protein [Clostridium sp.]